VGLGVGALLGGGLGLAAGKAECAGLAASRTTLNIKNRRKNIFMVWGDLEMMI
jgi:hypothetical protein